MQRILRKYIVPLITFLVLLTAIGLAILFLPGRVSNQLDINAATASASPLVPTFLTQTSEANATIAQNSTATQIAVQLRETEKYEIAATETERSFITETAEAVYERQTAEAEEATIQAQQTWDVVSPTPSPTYTATPSPTLTPSVTPSATNTLTPTLTPTPLSPVCQRGLNGIQAIRAYPFLNYDYQRTNNSGMVKILGRSIDGQWLFVEHTDTATRGWVSINGIISNCDEELPTVINVLENYSLVFAEDFFNSQNGWIPLSADSSEIALDSISGILSLRASPADQSIISVDPESFAMPEDYRVDLIFAFSNGSLRARTGILLNYQDAEENSAFTDSGYYELSLSRSTDLQDCNVSLVWVQLNPLRTNNITTRRASCDLSSDINNPELNSLVIQRESGSFTLLLNGEIVFENTRPSSELAYYDSGTMRLYVDATTREDVAPSISIFQQIYVWDISEE